MTFAVGEYVVPFTETQTVLFKAAQSGGRKLGSTGAWLKERRVTDQGERSFSVNVSGHRRPGHAGGHPHLRVRCRRAAPVAHRRQAGRVGADSIWTLTDAELTTLARQWRPRRTDTVQRQALPTLRWPSTLSAGVVSAAVLPLKTMSAAELWRYSDHLSDQEQASQRHRIQFWKKALYPLACLVLTALALPFAYLHARAGGISLKVFGGIMLGISFVLLNNVAGHIGMLRGWTPWLVAAMPSALFMLLSLAAFGWLVRYR